VNSANRVSATSRKPDPERAIYAIGPFRLDPATGTLTRDGRTEPLGPRAVAVLTSIVSRAPQPVPKDAVIDEAWPGIVVEENNLTVQVSAIRRALAQVPGGDRWVETVARRGYRFVGPVTKLSGRSAANDGLSLGNIPAALTTFIGRERELVDLKLLLAKNRLLTLVGPGGIGKTRLALQLGAEVADAFGDGTWLVDLVPIADPQLVANAMAQALNVQQIPARSLEEAIARYCKGRRLLVIVDNCEHVLDASARLIEHVLRFAPEPTIIATSREPLRVEGEQIYRLSSLSLPDTSAELESLRRSEAVQLFVDRAQHQQPDFALTIDRATSVANLCRCLDGIPLALELAAAKLHALSIEEICSRLDDRFSLLTEGSRTALPRHQTLHATLDWSHDLLREAERKVLRRLAVFSGGFTLDAASAVATDADFDAVTVSAIVSHLVAHSLVVADTNATPTRFGFLETTRAYALQKLEDANETLATRQRHLRHFRERFARASDDWLRVSDPEFRATYVVEMDNVRAALDFGFGTDGDLRCAIGLAASSGPVWPILALYGEGIQRLEIAASRQNASTLKLDSAQLALWLGLLWQDPAPAKAVTPYEEAARLFRELGDQLSLAQTLVRLARVRCYMGDLDSAAKLLAEASPMVERSGRPKLATLHHQNLGFCHMLSGDPAAARVEYRKALEANRGAWEFALFVLHENIADASWALGDLPAAAMAFREAIAAQKASPRRRMDAVGFALLNLAGVLTEMGEVDAALAAAREGIPLQLDRGRSWVFMDHLALRSALAGNTRSSARLAGYADALVTAKQAPREPNEARAYSRVQALLREQLDVAELERLLAEGARMTELEACRLALED
jgi:non-specific serine/threonine protein kinase